MSEPKDSTSFFRKVVKFVANPTTEWADVGLPQDETRENEFAKSELKAMIERKRRNDFVRKREFDMLRKVRREGLSPEQLAALGGSSKLDDSEGKISVAESGAKQDAGVKAKIDEIEQQMVGDGFGAPQPSRRGPEFFNAPTQPAPMGSNAPSKPMPLNGTRAPAEPPMAAPTPAAAVMGAGLSPLSPLSLDANTGDFGNAFAVEVSEVAHDPELDEALAELDETDRDALALRFFDHCAHADVAARLRVSENAARMRVDRALDKLRERLLSPSDWARWQSRATR